MRQAALILALAFAAQPAWIVEGRLHDPAVTRSLAYAGDCPVPPHDTHCSFDSEDPMRFDCGGCYYQNACLAETVNFYVERDCKPLPVFEPTCPLPPRSASFSCTLEYQPVKCNGCEYANECLAKAALRSRHDVKCVQPEPLFDKDGNRIYGQLGQPNDPELCYYGPDIRRVCPADFTPLKCNGCIFINSCLANSHGYDADRDCISL
jgi:hypothetical protein